MQLLLGGIRGVHAALKVPPGRSFEVNMSDKQSDILILDHAYGDGKLAGFWGLGTSAACPYGSDQIGPRIAWLDGFADGVWKGGAKINALDLREEYEGAGLEAFDRPDLDIVNVAVAHLLRLSKAVETRGEQGRELDSALKAAAKFVRFVQLTQAAREDRPELTKRRNRADKQTREGRLGETVVEIR
jgi:hypothetical protein